MINIALTSLAYLRAGVETEQEPYLWPVCFVIDDTAALFTLARMVSAGRGAQIPRELVQRLPFAVDSLPTLFGRATTFFAAPGGSHGNVTPGQLRPGAPAAVPAVGPVSLPEATGILGDAALVGLVVVLLEEDDVPSHAAIADAYARTFVPQVLERLAAAVEGAIKAFGAKPAMLTNSLAQHIAVRGAGDRIVLRQSGLFTPARATDLSSAASAPPAIGTPLLVEQSSGPPHVLYRSREGSIVRLRRASGGWLHERLVEPSHLVASSDLHWWLREGWMFVTFRSGSDAAQISINTATGETRQRNLSDTVAGLSRRLREVVGEVTGYHTPAGHRLLLTHPDGQTTSLRMVALDSWVSEGFGAGHPPPAFAPVGLAIGTSEFVVYVAADGHVHELYREGGEAWRRRALTAGARAGHRAIGAPSIARYPPALDSDGRWVATWRTASGLAVAERFTGGLRVSAVADTADAAGDPVVSTDNYPSLLGRPFGFIHVAYSTTDLGLHHVVKGTDLAEWSHSDLTAALLAAAPLTGSAATLRTELLERIRDGFSEAPFFMNTDDVIDAALSLTPLRTLPLGRAFPITLPLGHPDEGSWALTATITRT